MRIKYKRVSVAMPHCGDCGEQLSGNGSDWTPYECPCGEWEYQWWKSWGKPVEYTLKKQNEKTKITK